MPDAKVRIQLDLRAHEARALDALRDRCELRSRAEAVRAALAVLEWVQGETQQGRRVLAVGEDRVSYLVVPGLTAAAHVSESGEERRI